MRLSVKIILIVTLLLTGCFGVVIWRSMALMERVVVDAIGKQQVELASNTLNQIDAYLYERTKDIDTLSQVARAQAILMGKVSPSVVQETIAKISIMNGPWDLVSLVSNKGIIVASTYNGEVGEQITEDPINYAVYMKAREGTISFSDKVISEESGQETIIFAAPVWREDASGVQQIGVVLGQTAWPPIPEILAKVDSHAVLLDKRGIVIAENSKHDFGGLLHQDMKDADMVKRALEQKSGHYSITTSLIGNREVLTSHMNEVGHLDYGGNGWVLMLEYPKTLLLAETKPWITQMMTSLTPVIIAGVVVIVLGMLLYIVKPIIRLTQASNLLGRGDFSQRVRVVSRDELGQLAETFNQMAAQLGSRQSDLEQQVAEKTKELAGKVEEGLRINEELEKMNKFMVGRELKMVELKKEIAEKTGGTL